MRKVLLVISLAVASAAAHAGIFMAEDSLGGFLVGLLHRIDWL